MAFDSALRWYHSLLVLIGWSLPTHLVGSVAVVVIDVLVQYRAQVTFTVDQHTVDHLGAYRTDPPLGIAIRPRCPRRRLQHRDTRSGEDLIEDGGELGGSIADEEAERRRSLAEVIKRLRAC